MIVTEEDRTFDVRGIAYGTRPAWEFIAENGQQMTRDQFLALKPATRDRLLAAVKRHMAEINAGRSPE